MDDGNKKARLYFIIGIVLLIIPFVNKFDDYDLELLVFGVISVIYAALHRFLPEFMRYNYNKIIGAVVVISGAWFYSRGILVGLGMCIAGVLIFLVKF